MRKTSRGFLQALEWEECLGLHNARIVLEKLKISNVIRVGFALFPPFPHVYFLSCSCMFSARWT